MNTNLNADEEDALGENEELDEKVKKILEEQESDEIEKNDEKESIREKKKVRDDVSEGKTIFLTQIPLDIPNEKLVSFFSQFGNVVYANRVYDTKHDRAHKKAFLKFFDAESLKKCLEAANNNKLKGDLPHLMLDSHRINVFEAVSRQKSKNITQTNLNKESKQNRNLLSFSSNYCQDLRVFKLFYFLMIKKLLYHI